MPDQRRRDSISTGTAIVFLFNLIVGAGSLALPGALQRAGWLLGITLLLALGTVSFITVTFVVESLAVTNAVAKQLALEGTPVKVGRAREEVEETPLVSNDGQENAFELSEKYEIGQMGTLLLPKVSQILVYLFLCIYLFGDLAIYAVVVGKTCSNIACRYIPPNCTYINVPDSAPCSEKSSLKRIDVYRISVAIFIALMLPFVFFNIQKTKLFQFLTTVMRWLSFLIMIVWAIEKLIAQGKIAPSKLANFKELPTIFGTLVYAFMCQHSIPGLLQPIRNKKHLQSIILVDFGLAATFYLVLGVTAILTFEHIFSIYTLNFWGESLEPNAPMYVTFFAYYLAMFPLFTFSTNFPIIAITLRNNIRNMCMRDRPYSCPFDRCLFPLITIFPPTILALIVSDIQTILGIVGSYAGAFVQYFIPCLLILGARKKSKDIGGVNIHASPFRGLGWVIAVYIWMIICLIVISINYVQKMIE